MRDVRTSGRWRYRWWPFLSLALCLLLFGLIIAGYSGWPLLVTSCALLVVNVTVALRLRRRAR